MQHLDSESFIQKNICLFFWLYAISTNDISQNDVRTNTLIKIKMMLLKMSLEATSDTTTLARIRLGWIRHSVKRRF